jgi:hypothetical protein
VEKEYKTVNIRISNEVYQYYKERSFKTGVSMSSLMFLSMESHIQMQGVINAVPEMVSNMQKFTPVKVGENVPLIKETVE